MCIEDDDLDADDLPEQFGAVKIKKKPKLLGTPEEIERDKNIEKLALAKFNKQPIEIPFEFLDEITQQFSNKLGQERYCDVYYGSYCDTAFHFFGDIIVKCFVITDEQYRHSSFFTIGRQRADAVGREPEELDITFDDWFNVLISLEEKWHRKYAHVDIIQLLGFSRLPSRFGDSSKNTLFLVYEGYSYRSLRDYLYSYQMSSALTWIKRITLITAFARILCHVQSKEYKQLPVFDIENIFISETFTLKLFYSVIEARLDISRLHLEEEIRKEQQDAYNQSVAESSSTQALETVEETLSALTITPALVSKFNSPKKLAYIGPGSVSSNSRSVLYPGKDSGSLNRKGMKLVSPSVSLDSISIVAESGLSQNQKAVLKAQRDANLIRTLGIVMLQCITGTVLSDEEKSPINISKLAHQVISADHRAQNESLWPEECVRVLNYICCSCLENTERKSHRITGKIISTTHKLEVIEQTVLAYCTRIAYTGQIDAGLQFVTIDDTSRFMTSRVCITNQTVLNENLKSESTSQLRIGYRDDDETVGKIARSSANQREHDLDNDLELGGNLFSSPV